jgi:uncharacterized membrane-anchored protein
MNVQMKTSGRTIVALIAGVLILALLNWNIFMRERLIEQGQVILLKLAPVDPRSLMQGDYMALRFALADEIRKTQGQGDRLPKDGIAILKLDEKNIARFVRLDDGSPLQGDEARLRYRSRDTGWRGDSVRIATNAFFFEEGQGETYETARYGEFRVDASGDAILTQMRDESLTVLGSGIR